MSRYCPNCNNELQEGMTFCAVCSTRIDGANAVNMAQANMNVREDRKGNTAMVCGIVGLFVAGIILGILAIVFANQSKETNNGVFTSKARAGFILGILDVVGAAITIYFW